MSMPLLPGLLTPGSAGQAPAGGGGGALTALIDSMAQDEVNELVAASDDWWAAGQPMPVAIDDANNDIDDTEPGTEQVGAEDAETLEEEAAESPEQQDEELATGAEHFDEIERQIAEFADRAESYENELQDLLARATADEESGADPKKVQKAIDDAAELLDTVAEQKEVAQEAIGEEDANAAAKAGLEIEKVCVKLDALVANARQAATGSKPTKADKAGGKPALALWARKFGG